MIALALLVYLAAQQSVVDAERDFARRAQTDGLWTAFRATAAPNALLFVPQPTNAQAWLKGRRDPANPYMWWPAKAFLSCDGKLAATTGPSILAGRPGYFTTIWTLRPEGWRWEMDHGDVATVPRAAGEEVATRKADCSPPATSAEPHIVSVHATGADDVLANTSYRFQESPDRSLRWSWHRSEEGARAVKVELWTGEAYEVVIDDRVGAGAQ